MFEENSANSIKNQLYDLIKKAEDNGATADELKEILGKAASKRGIFEGQLDDGELEIGQIASDIHEVQSVAEIMKRMAREFDETRNRLVAAL